MTDKKPNEVVLEDDDDILSTNIASFASFTPDEKNYLKDQIGTERYNKNVLYNKHINIECEKIKKLLESVIYLNIYQMDKGKVNIYEVNDELLTTFLELTERYKNIKNLFAKKSHMLY